MTTLHTPGPWGQSNGIVFAPTGAAIAKIYKQQSPTVTRDNARLISAAPDLLDALDTIAMGNTDPDRMIEIARAAIAKANEVQA
jgi:hypothetical protein